MKCEAYFIGVSKKSGEANLTGEPCRMKLKQKGVMARAKTPFLYCKAMLNLDEQFRLVEEEKWVIQSIVS